MSLTSQQKIGIALLVGSIVVGLIGSVVSIYLGFSAIETSEVSGIGTVGERIGYAIFFTAAGILGSLIGLGLLIFGRSRR